MNFFSFADSVLVPAFPATFLAMESFFLSASGLFDFDLTFAAEAILFIILAFVVTSVYLNPIAKQIDDRNEFVNKNLLESYFTLAIGHQNISESVKILLLEIEELRSQGNKVSWHDPLVKTWGTENSTDLNEISDSDFVIVSILHDAVEKSTLINAKKDIYDLTGTLKDTNLF